MFKSSLQWFKKIGLVLLVVAMVAPSAQAFFFVSAPVLTNLRFNTNPFNPNIGSGYNLIQYDLSTDANILVDVLDNSNNVVRALTDQVQGPPSGGVSWDGKYVNGQNVPAGTYTIRVQASNPYGADALFGNMTIQYGSVGVAPVISSLTSSPSTFNPDTESTLFTYILGPSNVGSTDVTVDVISNSTTSSTVVRTLQSQTQTFGTHALTWDGRGMNGSRLNAGTYTFKVQATNSYGTDIQTASVTLQYNQSTLAPDITGLSVSPNPFNPNNQSTTFTYTLNTNANVTVAVNVCCLATSITVSNQNQGPGTYTATWNGRDNNGSIFTDGSRTFTVTATNAYGTDVETGSVTISSSNTPAGTPNITNVYASPTTFNPYNQSTTIYFTVDMAARITVDVLDFNNSVIRNLTNSQYGQSGNFNISWDGRDNGSSYVLGNVYTYRISANTIDGSRTVTGLVTVSYGNTGGIPNITNVYASPNPFNSSTNSTTLYYTLDKSAQVTVEVMNGNSVVRTLVDNMTQSSGNFTSIWNGQYGSGTMVNDGTYTFRVRATNGSGTDTKTTTVQVSRDYNGGGTSTGTLIKNIMVNPDVFNPSFQTGTVYYSLLQNSTVSVEILDNNGNVVRTLVDNITRYPNSNLSNGYSTYSYADTWNGRDRFGNIVANGLYRFRIRATSNGQSDNQIAYIQVSTNGNIVPFPQGSTCGGFSDVSVNSPYCKAIEQMKQFGIFNGYDDGTFRPYRQINRAEATKVILNALNISVNNTNYYRNFPDVSNAWYAPYVQTASLLSIVRGYPDGTFRPVQTINRVELLKIFLESSGLNIPYCNSAPYRDVPVNADTRWYVDYVCFAKENSLMHDDGVGRFSPATSMTRGDVADLFYQFQLRGLESKVSTPKSGNYSTTYYY